MNKLHIHLLGRFMIVMMLVCSLSISALGGVLEVGASAKSPEPKIKDNEQTIKSAKNKTYNDIDRAWTYQGHWSKDKIKRAFGGQFHASNTVADYATISVEGLQFTLIYSTAPNYGQLDVFVDDLKIHTINQNKSNTSYQEEWTSPELASGVHAVKFVHATGNTVNIDAIKVRGPKPKPGNQPTEVPINPETPTSIPSNISTATMLASPTNVVPQEDPTQTLLPEVPSSPVPSSVPDLPELPTQTKVSSPTPSIAPSPVPTSTAAPTMTQVPTPTPSPVPSAVPTFTASPTYIPTNTATLLPSPTATAAPAFPAGSGKVFYVATTGNDSNPGTENQPFRTIQRAVNSVIAGDTVYVRGGVYNEIVSISKTGNATAPITISSYPNEQAIIDGNNTLPGSRYAKLVGVGGSYTIFRNFEVRNSNGRGIQVSGSYNSVIENNVHHIWDSGIYIAGSNITIENNRVWRSAESNYNRSNGDWSGGIAWGAAFSPNSAPSVVIRKNLVYQNSGEGIICMYTDNGLVDGNTVYDNWAMNIYVDQCSNMTIKDNLVYYTADKQFWRYSNAPQGGIVLANEGLQSYPIGHDRKIINNVLVNNGSNISFWIGKATGAALINDLIANNTLVNAYSTGFNINSAPHQQTRIVNNLVLQSTGTSASVSGGGITFSNNLWYPLNGIAGPGDVRQDPQLQNPGAPILAGSVDAHWYNLKSSSPGINSGTTITSVNDDFDGTSRPAGPQYDIGAFEH